MDTEHHFGMSCPKCGGSHHIDIAARVFVRVVYDGTDADQAADTSHDWEDTSPAICRKCDFVGDVAAFLGV